MSFDKLNSLYSNSEVEPCNSKCTGCSILEKKKPIHSWMDYLHVIPGDYDILFVTGSLAWENGIKVLSGLEEEVYRKYIYPIVKDSAHCFSAATKCPDLVDKDIKTKDRAICSAHLEDTLKHIKPKLIIACGNLALRMLTKKSGISNNRGTIHLLDGIPVAPVEDLISVALEPRKTILLQQDIKNAYDKYILKTTVGTKLNYTIIYEIAYLKKIYDFLSTTTGDISVDIETAGLNFKKDNIYTVGIAYKEEGSEEYKQIIIPYKHWQLTWGDEEMAYIKYFLVGVLKNPNNRKIGQNVGFDLKFLLQEGIEAVNVWDTKLMFHCVNENLPKSLLEIVKKFFPDELEEF